MEEKPLAGKVLQSEHSTQKYYDEDEVSLLDLMVVFAKWRRLIIGITLLFVLGAGILAFLMTPQYKASVQIVNNNKTYLGLLKSTEVQDYLLERFAPQDWRSMVGPGKKLSREALVKKYIGEMNAQASKEGIINLSVAYNDPQKAATIANAYVEALEDVVRKITYGKYEKKREDYKHKLDKATKELRAMEKELKSLEERLGFSTGMTEGEQKWKLDPLIKGWFKLQEEVVEKTIQIEKARLEKGDDTRIALEAELEFLKDRLETYEKQVLMGSADGQRSGYLSTFGDYLRKRRDWLWQLNLCETLQDLYNEAKLQEETLSVSVLTSGKAVPPDRPFKPNKKLLIAIASILGLFLAIFVAFFLEFFHRASENPENEEKVKIIKEAFTWERP
ncbi:Wzz/FepE/Etk N-terminal domain-containing protein [Thermovirga sp.]|uniref:Wzz/FepE/Etk N-terminal domain-containing protein n=1 Tax=Thermovirga sp. TaxID=2699834 RepID=UPI0025EF6B8C|nr:Wzz/FepE/Etk N-terminal domain-containing protein [Thermovirga sp.]MBO8154807.1 hypothetical protein [Thermovirga sp.]